MFEQTPMHPNEIELAYMQMVNTGQNAVLQIGGPNLSVNEWRDQQIKRWEEYIAQQQTEH